MWKNRGITRIGALNLFTRVRKRSRGLSTVQAQSSAGPGKEDGVGAEGSGTEAKVEASRTKREVGKKIIVACDGTWSNSDMGVSMSLFTPPVPQIPTNVTRIVRALTHLDASGIPQIVYYQRGVGTDGDTEDKYIGGLTGNDLSELVREAYGFVANNYNPDTQADLEDKSKPLDDIVLLGFSRGAFTARAIADLISDVGLLTKIGMESFWGIFGDWMRQDTEAFAPWFASQFGEKVQFTDERYREVLISEGLTRWGMPIRAVGVWDTVGTLGIPLPWGQKNVKEYSFVNTKVAKHVLNAFQALALDEHRQLFIPTLWEEPDTNNTIPAGFEQPHRLAKLKQTWFPGAHSNTGGGYADAGISNLALAWMISQLEDTDGGILTFNSDFLDYIQDQDFKTNRRPWGLGRLYDSDDTFIGAIEGINPTPRTPGRYYEVDLSNGKPVKKPERRLRNTHECIHACVRVRIDEHGPGTEEAPSTSVVGKLFDTLKHLWRSGQMEVYDSKALSNYQLVQSKEVQNGNSGQLGEEVVWKAKDGLGDLNEDKLGRTEVRLLERSLGKMGQAGEFEG